MEWGHNPLEGLEKRWLLMKMSDIHPVVGEVQEVYADTIQFFPANGGKNLVSPKNTCTTHITDFLRDEPSS